MNSGQAFRTAALARRADADSTSQYGKEAQRRQSGAVQGGKEFQAGHGGLNRARLFIQALLRGTLRRQSLLPAEFIGLGQQDMNGVSSGDEPFDHLRIERGTGMTRIHQQNQSA